MIGITETVAEIMARTNEPDHTSASPEEHSHRPRLETEEPGLNNPLSPLVPRWPGPDSSSNGPAPLLPQIVGTSFLAITLGESGAVPPDSMGAVGPTQVVCIANGRIKLFSKSGSSLALNATTDSFFRTVRGTSGTSDPHLRYDRLSGRWFVVMINLANKSNRILIAVSSGPNITDSTSFTFFQFAEDFDGGDPGLFADYPTLGVDRFALYIGVNNFLSSSGGPSTRAGFVVNKASLLAGGPIVVTAFRNLDNDGLGNGIKTPQGVDNDDPAATEGYFIGVDSFLNGKLDIRRILDPGGTPSMSPSLIVTVPSTAAPIPQSHKADQLGKKLDAVSDRLFAAAIHKNKLTGSNTLCTAHNIEVDTTGVGSAGGGRNGSRWYEIGDLTGTPTLIQAGTLFDSGTSNPRGYWMPSVAISGQGHLALGCSYAASNAFAGIAVSGRLRTDPPGATQPATLSVVSASAYNLDETETVHRWGDFSQTVVDPADDMTMWTFQEYCNAVNSWGLRVLQLRAAPPATPASASPDNLLAGATADLSIQGTSSFGSEFFDPGADPGGPGYPNHLSAVITGGGVTVNSVSFVNPTNLILNVSVATNAVAGTRGITITNPDGRTASASGLLTIRSAPIISSGPGDQMAAQGSDATFSVAATGTAPLSYQWRLNQDAIPSATNTSYTVTNVQCGQEAVYDVVITNSLGSVTSSIAALIVVSPPVITTEPVASQSVNGGDTVLLSVAATNDCGDSLAYQWQQNGIEVAGATSSTFNLAAAQWTNTGDYVVIITNIAGSITSSVSALTVIVPPVADFSSAPTSGVAVLSVAFTNLSFAGTNYTWDFGDGNTSTEVSPVNNYSNAGLYSVTLSTVGPGGTNVLTRTNYILVFEAPRLVSSPSALDFGPVFTNLSSYGSLMISNAGGSVLNATGQLSPGAFAFLSPGSNQVTSISFDVSAHNSTNLTIAFSPVALGVFSNSVLFAGNGGTANVALGGQGVPAPALIASPLNSSNLLLSFDTITSKVYLVQFKTALDDPQWQTLDTVNGDGTLRSVTNNTGSVSKQFYRLLVQ